MDVLFVVVDSLRADPFADGRVARTPFLDSLSRRALSFSRAYATECWTLPSHASMFTGLMPSEHGAHFHSMAYQGEAPTIAECLAGRGYETESVTRNFIFDGTIPGITRGFARRTAIVNQGGMVDPTALFLAVAKPRFRRHLRNTGFFHSLQRGDHRFAETFARALQPADEPLLRYLAERAGDLRARNRRFFLFANLYDVHAPYPPAAGSLLRSWRTLAGVRENLLAPVALSRLGEHRYLQRGFQMAESMRNMLEERYRWSVELMDQKLRSFFADLDARNLLDGTLVVLVSDHGEGFGEHGLFLHDASLFETHLHVPLWVMTPAGDHGCVDDVVSTRHLFGLVNAMVDGDGSPTILDAEFRGDNPVAFAQHFHYPHLPDALPIYRREQFAAISRTRKMLNRGGNAVSYDLSGDPRELDPAVMTPHEALELVVADSGCTGQMARRVWSDSVRYAAAAR